MRRRRRDEVHSIGSAAEASRPDDQDVSVCDITSINRQRNPRHPGAILACKEDGDLCHIVHVPNTSQWLISSGSLESFRRFRGQEGANHTRSGEARADGVAVLVEISASRPEDHCHGRNLQFCPERIQEPPLDVVSRDIIGTT